MSAAARAPSLEKRVEQLVEQLVDAVKRAPFGEVMALSERPGGLAAVVRGALPALMSPARENPSRDTKKKRRRTKRAAKHKQTMVSQRRPPSSRSKAKPPTVSHDEGHDQVDRIMAATSRRAARATRKSVPPPSARLGRATKLAKSPKTSPTSEERQPDRENVDQPARRRRGRVANLPGTHAFVVVGFNGELVVDTDDASEATAAMKRTDACSKYRRADGALLQGPKKAYERDEDKSTATARSRAFADESMLDNEGVEELADA